MGYQVLLGMWAMLKRVIVSQLNMQGKVNTRKRVIYWQRHSQANQTGHMQVVSLFKAYITEDKITEIISV